LYRQLFKADLYKPPPPPLKADALPLQGEGANKTGLLYELALEPAI